MHRKYSSFIVNIIAHAVRICIVLTLNSSLKNKCSYLLEHNNEQTEFLLHSIGARSVKRTIGPTIPSDILHV